MIPFFLQRRLFGLWLALFPAFVVLWYFPYIDFPIRVLTWMVGFLFLAGTIYYSWKTPVIRWLLVIIYLLAIVFLLLPAHRPPDRPALRTEYLGSLKSYLGCRYVWGGETCTGIDCSGLVRKGLEDALAKRGISTFDPGLLRQSISLYWHDTNARTMGEGYAGRTKFITTCRNLNVLNYSLLKPGDLAVTAGGDHVMAYLGDKTWIAADPGLGKVAEFHIPVEKDPYFSTEMHIMRWQIFGE